MERGWEIEKLEHLYRRQSYDPELYQVYQGRVSRVMDVGCFVQLNEFRGREGLVHVSQISSGKLGTCKDAVKRDQEVFVKVIAFSGQKNMSLSMRDVDQGSGRDLRSEIRIVEEDDVVQSRRP